MKALALGVSYVILYTAVGAAFLWNGRSQGMGFYVFAGLCFLALAAWEGRIALREYRKGRKPGWRLTMNIAYILLALCYVYKGFAEPNGFNVGIAVCWSILGVLYAAKAVRELRAADQEKEEAS